MMGYMPEGATRVGGYTADELMRAMERGESVEGRVTLCDHRYNLHVRLGDGLYGIIPKEESQYTDGEPIKDIAILTRVGKCVTVKITDVSLSGGAPFFILSRRAAQAECVKKYLSQLIPGDVIPARVTHLESFGAFVDIGCGICSLLPIDCISVSRISHPAMRMSVGESIRLVVKGRDEVGRITVSMKELFGSWEENAALFSEGQTVRGIVRGIESYGIFVELKPNLAGLAEWRSEVYEGDVAAVFIKAIIPEKMKVKLIIIDSVESDGAREPLGYFVDTERVRHIDRWEYSPRSSKKRIETVFT